MMVVGVRSVMLVVLIQASPSCVVEIDKMGYAMDRGGCGVHRGETLGDEV